MKLRVVRESSSLRTGVALVAAAAVLGAFPSAGSTRGTGASVAATPKLGPVQHAHANGIDIGYRVGGRGLWLVMVKASPKQVSRAPSSASLSWEALVGAGDRHESRRRQSDRTLVQLRTVKAIVGWTQDSRATENSWTASTCAPFHSAGLSWLSGSGLRAGAIRHERSSRRRGLGSAR